MTIKYTKNAVTKNSTIEWVA